jgi:hypothetical protein
MESEKERCEYTHSRAHEYQTDAYQDQQRRRCRRSLVFLWWSGATEGKKQSHARDQQRWCHEVQQHFKQHEGNAHLAGPA